MPAASVMVTLTVQQIEAVALLTLKRISQRQSQNKIIIKKEREAYATLARKIDSIMELRGDFNLDVIKQEN